MLFARKRNTSLYYYIQHFFLQWLCRSISPLFQQAKNVLRYPIRFRNTYLFWIICFFSLYFIMFCSSVFELSNSTFLSIHCIDTAHRNLHHHMSENKISLLWLQWRNVLNIKILIQNIVYIHSLRNHVATHFRSLSSIRKTTVKVYRHALEKLTLNCIRVM